MEQPLSLLTFSGSIPEAIMEAKNQRKVFVVYISGENEDSVRLEKSVWLDSRVAECITKYCVLLHLPEGTTDATNFSAIYPQKSSPCINAVGYNGMLLWQNDGCISPENLISSIEKAWLSLHIQETTATVLTAALSSKKIDQSLNETSTLTSVPHKDGESSGSSSPVPSEKLSKPSGSAQLASPEAMDEDRDDDDHVLLGSKELPKQKDMKTDNNEQSVPPNEVVKVREPNRDPAATGQDHHEVSKPCHVEEECSNRKDAAKYPSELMNREIKGDLLDEPSVPAGMGDSSSVVNDDTSSELLLNIRLPTGANLQDKFLKIDALRLVKGYVDSNMADFNGSYDLAIPYPRKVFKDQDLDKSLSEGTLSSWSNSTKEEEDCCTWEGIFCDDQTRHVIDLSLSGLRSNHLRPSLLELQHLSSLELSNNNFSMRIPEFIGSFRKLTNLDLSDSGFFGMIPSQLGNLSNIQSLNIGSNNLSCDNLKWLSQLSSIQTLDMRSLNLEARDWLSVLRNLSFLSQFSCNSCYFTTQKIPSSFHNNFSSSSSLQTIDISDSIIDSSTLSLWISSTYNLSELHMGSLNLDGPVLNVFDHIGKLCNLNYLDASSCDITERIADVFHVLEICASNSLENLFLYQNNLTGTIPLLGKFRSLQLLSLDDNLLESFAPNNSTLSLSNHSANISSLSISRNNLSGMFSGEYWANLPQLYHLDLSNNPNLKVSFSQPLTKVQEVFLRSCNLGPKFPSWLLASNEIVNLDISQSKISGSIPTAFWSNISPSLLTFNLSYNNLHGIVPNLPFRIQGIFPFMITIDLSSNAFYGPIPIFIFQANNLYLSNNNFSSFAPLPYSNHSLVNARDFLVTSILDISNNNLGGEIPNWFWSQMPYFSSINLANNNISGEIPSSIESPPTSLYQLNLSYNKLSGWLPSWLKNCTSLILLNLSANRFSGLLPSLLGESLKRLIVLSLESNNLTGTLPSDLCHLTSLQILDLSHNKFSGNIPLCLCSFFVMSHHVNSSTQIILPGSRDVAIQLPIEDVDFYSAFIKWKGVNRFFKKNLKWVKLIDLSNNLLSGEIPTELMCLVELDSLDLSSNNFYGHIPDQIGQLKYLEYLNLSYNKLSGPIPPSLSQISSLGMLDLSYNNLSGRIPKGTQLQGFNSSYFAGNPMLCDLPLPVRCPGDVDDSGGTRQPSTTYEGDKWSDKQCFYGGLGTGFAFGFLGVLVTLASIISWRYAFFRFAAEFGEWILLIIALSMLNLKLSKMFGVK